MKKLIALVLSAAMVLALAACGETPAQSTAAPQQTTAAETKKPETQPAESQQTEQTTAAPADETLSAAAEAYPEKAVKIIIPYGAGGSTDMGGRVVAEYLKNFLPGNYVAENQAGGAAVPGTIAVINEDPNATGYVLGYNWYASFNFRPQFMETGYTMDDFTFIAGMTIQRNTLAIRADETRYSDVDTLIQYIKDHPNDLTYGCGAANSWQLLICLNFLNAYGVADLVDEVPQTSAAEVRTQLLNGSLDFALLETATFASDINTFKETGKCDVKFICSFEKDRNEVSHPDCPTIVELGYPEVADVAENCLVLVGPKGMDAGIVKKLQDACEAMSKDAAFLDASVNCKQEIKFQTGEAVTAALKNSMEPVANLLKQAGMVQ